MRAVLTVERYAPAIGGAERVVQRIAEGLAARGHEIHVMTSGAAEDETRAGVMVHRRPLAGNETRGISGPVAEPLRLIEDLGPELVFNYAAQTWTTDLCFALLEQTHRPAMALAPCGFSQLRARRYRAYYAAMAARLRRYDALILHSRVYQDWRFCEEAGAKRMVVIPNGADAAAAPEHQPGGERKLVVTVGSHVRSKGHAAFASSVQRLGAEHDLIGAIVAPPRHGLAALRGCAAGCRVREKTSRGHLKLVDGRVSGAAAEWIASADLFLFTSLIECAPLVIIEAMAAGVPWVSYDVGNVAELPGGIVAGSRDELQRAAAAVLDGQHPALGRDGRAAWDATHRWDAIVDQYETVFASLIEARDAGATR